MVLTAFHGKKKLKEIHQVSVYVWTCPLSEFSYSGLVNYVYVHNERYHFSGFRQSINRYDSFALIIDEYAESVNRFTGYFVFTGKIYCFQILWVQWYVYILKHVTTILTAHTVYLTTINTSELLLCKNKK